MIEDIFEQRRIDALRARKPLEYFEYCVASNTDWRENPELYNEGAILFDMKRGDFSEVSGLPNNARYVLLRESAKSLSSRPDGDSTSKKRLLRTLFPKRFGKDGKQNISGYSESEVGSLFGNVVDYSKRFEYDFSK